MYFDTTTIDMHARAVEEQDAREVAFDEAFPGWETREQDPEERRLIDESDVADAGEYTTRLLPGTAKGYVLIPPAHATF